MNNPDPTPRDLDATPRVSADRLRTFISQAFEKAGVPAGDAGSLAGLITEADLRGTDTQGVLRLPLYVRRIKAGGINKRPNIRVVSEKPAAALIDGDNGMGHLVMARAAETAIELARAAGIGWVGARRSNQELNLLHEPSFCGSTPEYQAGY